MKIEPVVLKGERVELEPLCLDHIGPLCEFGFDESLWRWTLNRIETEGQMRAYVESGLTDQRNGTALPFVTNISDSGQIVGSTRFGNIDVKNKRAEIGWTWIDPRWQRSFVNTEAKLLMLTHAFETWGCNRVEFKTDVLNERSRNAIERIGGVNEGIFRHHMIADDGRIRDTIYFSIIDTEWERVKAELIEKLRGL